jgi:hypothetical protein
MIYTAKASDSSATQNLAYTQRGLNGLTQASLGDLNIFSKAEVIAPAYGGYKDAIEAFIYATAVQAKVDTSSSVYAIPEAYTPKVPFTLPPVMFGFKTKPTPEFIQRMKDGEKIKDAGFQTHLVGKNNHVYSVDRPDFGLFMKMTTLLNERAPHTEGYCSVDGMLWGYRIMQMIDLFLAVRIQA